MSTIVAISTAPGIGGIGIIRMSGKECFKILEKIFIPKQKNIEIKGYSIKYGNIIDNDKKIDEVLVSYFLEPKSYTTENMCEINSHGGNVVMQKIVELCLKNGAVMAEPGEFTKRAFLNGRIDLTQAESVIDIINSKTEKEAQASINQLEGFLSKKIKEIKQDILDIMVDIEASIDYPEYDIEEVTNRKTLEKLEGIELKLKELSNSFENGKILRDGIKTAIIGSPNAGKSSLLNAILKEERAIVTEYAGTTRDTIEEFVTINGIPLKIIDTAGIRKTDDAIEQMGIKKSKKIAEESELIIAIFDASKELNEEDKEILEIVKNKNAIIILNKIDLIDNLEIKEEIKNAGKDIIEISALKKQGILDIYSKISEMYQINKINLESDTIITNARHKSLIDQAIIDLKETKKTLNNNMPIDICAISIKNILEKLSKITGESVSEDIIKEIFSKFCLGK